MTPQIREQIVAWRRDFHRHPELGFQETWTAARVAEIMVEVLTKRDDATVAAAAQEVKQITLAHPIPESFI